MAHNYIQRYVMSVVRALITAQLGRPQQKIIFCTHYLLHFVQSRIAFLSDLSLLMILDYYSETFLVIFIVNFFILLPILKKTSNFRPFMTNSSILWRHNIEISRP